MAEFLLELLCEEIPARMQTRASQDLKRIVTEITPRASSRLNKWLAFMH